MNMDLQTNRMFTVDLNPLESIDGCSEFQGQAGVGEGAYPGYRASLCFPIIPMASEKYWLMLQ